METLITSIRCEVLKFLSLRLFDTSCFLILRLVSLYPLLINLKYLIYYLIFPTSMPTIASGQVKP